MYLCIFNFLIHVYLQRTSKLVNTMFVVYMVDPSWQQALRIWDHFLINHKLWVVWFPPEGCLKPAIVTCHELLLPPLNSLSASAAQYNWLASWPAFSYHTSSHMEAPLLAGLLPSKPSMQPCWERSDNWEVCFLPRVQLLQGPLGLVN